MVNDAEITLPRLPVKTVRSADGSVVRVTVVQSESDTLALDLLAAFQSNVRRIKLRRRKLARAAENAA